MNDKLCVVRGDGVFYLIGGEVPKDFQGFKASGWASANCIRSYRHEDIDLIAEATDVDRSTLSAAGIGTRYPVINPEYLDGSGNE